MPTKILPSRLRLGFPLNSNASSTALRIVLVLAGVFIILTGINITFGGMQTLGWQGKSAFFEVTNEHAFLVHDSHIRFLSGLWLGVGALFIVAATNLRTAPFGIQEMLIVSAPEKYFKPPYVGVRGWVGVELARISDEELDFHLRQAWRQIAPKNLHAALIAPEGRAEKAALAKEDLKLFKKAIAFVSSKDSEIAG
jgi:hypothetical protein